MTSQTKTQTQTSGDSHVATFVDRADRFTTILAAAGDAWDAPTPCEGWSVRDVVGHVLETQRDFLARQRLDPGAAPDLTHPGSAWHTHREHVLAVLRTGDVAAREYDGYFGRTTIGATLADFYGWDLVVHGWDVARATGQEWSIGDDEVALLQTTADGWGDALYSEGICASPVAVAQDAPAADRLLARLGRDPHWQPAGGR